MADDKETCITRIVGDDHVGIYTGETKFLNKIKKLKELYPDEVIITHINDDGSICVNVPYDWLKFPSPKKKCNFTDEQKAKIAERLAKNRKK